MSLGANHGTPDATSNIGSGGELESPLIPWMGPPNQMRPLDIDQEGKNPHVTHNLPLAFWGRSKAMETLIQFRVTSKSEWYATELMPWRASEDLNFTWTVLSYEKSYFEVEPYGGNPNYIQSGIEGYSDKMIQRGMAFTIAHGFWKTEMGKQQYKMNFEVLESSAQLTIYHLIIMSLLRSKNVYRNFELKFKNPVTTIRDALKRLKIRWAILNKGMDEFRKFHADLIEVMERNGVKPTLWALPPKSKILMTHAHKSETEYSSAGDLAIKARLEGQKAVDTFRGLKVFETTVFNELMFGSLYNPLRRIREYGSFHWITNYFGGSHLANYKNEDRFAAKILDADKEGQETKVSGQPLFQLSTRFDADGHLSSYHKQLIQDNKLNEMRRRLNDKHDNNYIDMFIGYDPTRDSNNPYYVMSYMGEQWDRDVSKTNIKDFATTACNKLKASMTEAEYIAIDNADQFMQGLTRVDLTGKYKYFFAALTLSGTIQNAENYGLDMFRANDVGCSMPPIIDGVNGLSIMVGGKREPLVFSEVDGSILSIYLESDFKALAFPTVPDGFKGNGLPIVTGVGADDGDHATAIPDKEDYDEKGTLVLGNAHRYLAKGRIFKVLDTSYEPIGWGTPAGIATLASMKLTGEYRGYNKNTLKKSVLHSNVLAKTFDVFNKIFPGHELTEDRACPFYFRCASPKTNRITAFGLNLYNHSKYPVFAIAPGKIGSGYSWLVDTVPQNAEAPLQTLSWMWPLIQTAITALGLATQQVSIKTRFDLVSKTGGSGVVNAALGDNKTMVKLEKNYRGKVYKDDQRTYTLIEFLTKVLATSNVDQRAVNSFVGVLEILLRDALDTPIDWKTEIERSQDRVIKLMGVGEKTGAIPTVASIDSRKAFNTRICIDPAAFIAIAELASGLNAAQIASQLESIVFLRPMNIFNPTQALGLVVSGTATHQNPNLAAHAVASDAIMKSLAEQLKFASAPFGRNTISSLTTSPAFVNHLDTTASSKKNKRASDEMTSGASANFKRRLIGGNVVSQNFDYFDAQSARDRLASAIPGARGIYTGLEDVVMDGEASIPQNIALDNAYRVFTFDGTHQDIAGNGGSQKVFRTKVVERFHEWAGETETRLRIFAQGWITQRINRGAYEAFWEQDCIPLVAFETWRIRQRYYMGSGFMAEGGEKLGNTFHGFHDFQWTDDIIRKVHVGHYTFNVACPVKDPKMFALAEDIVAMGYRSGEGVDFINGPEDFHTLCQDPDNAPGSILVKMVPYNRKLPSSPQDVSGRWNMSIAMQVSTDGLSGDNPIHGESSYYYNSVYGLDRLNSALTLREPVFHNPTSVVNTVGWRGIYFEQSICLLFYRTSPLV